MVHLACHGVHDPENPLASALRLGDRWVTARDVMGMELRGSAVVLSGCDTGRLGTGYGEEVYGLARGFFVAGARSVVSTLWTAHDAQSRAVMEELHARSGNGGGMGNLRSGLAAVMRDRITNGVHPAWWGHVCLLGG